MRCDNMRWRPAILTSLAPACPPAARTKPCPCAPAPILCRPGPAPPWPCPGTALRRPAALCSPTRRTPVAHRCRGFPGRRKGLEFDLLPVEQGHGLVQHTTGRLGLYAQAQAEPGLGHALRQHALATGLVDGVAEAGDLCVHRRQGGEGEAAENAALKGVGHGDVDPEVGCAQAGRAENCRVSTAASFSSNQGSGSPSSANCRRSHKAWRPAWSSRMRFLT